MKRDWKKEEKALYLPGKAPVLVTVPRHRFFVIDGAGNPNEEPFTRAVGALYTLAWTVRMLHKSGDIPPGFYEYTVFPLEALWAGGGEGAALDKDRLEYRLMIRQPDFVDEALFDRALASARKKKPSPELERVALEEIADGRSVQMMHIGPYDDEPASFARMDAFLEQSGLRRVGESHREIYIGNPERTAPEKLRTVLRYFV